jgi:hypothetical protein
MFAVDAGRQPFIDLEIEILKWSAEALVVSRKLCCDWWGGWSTGECGAKEAGLVHGWRTHLPILETN